MIENLLKKLLIKPNPKLAEDQCLQTQDKCLLKAVFLKDFKPQLHADQTSMKVVEIFTRSVYLADLPV